MHQQFRNDSDKAHCSYVACLLAPLFIGHIVHCGQKIYPFYYGNNEATVDEFS